MYSEKVMEHFRNPHNMGKMKDPDGVGKVGNPVCGDMMVIYIKIGRDKIGKEIIDDIKVETFGCVAAIATSSVLTDIVKGKTLEYAKGITNKDVANALEKLPPLKMHCSNLAADALKEAIKDYESKNKK
ncbi:MAG: iron-sulfur cluster assembly scaffold protein [Nanoarchaeota archaeon]